MRLTRAGEPERRRDRRAGRATPAGAGEGRGRGALLAAALGLAVMGCKGEKKEDPIGVPPPQGAASSDELSTAIGQARGISSSLAPTSTRWRRAVVLDERRAVLIGEVVNETIALVTDNAGRTWHSLRMERDGWSTWSVGADGAAVLAVGARSAPERQLVKDPRDLAPPADPLRLHFAAFDAKELTAPTPVTLPKRSPTAKLPVDVTPAVLAADRAALVIEEAPRRSVLIYTGLPGAEAMEPVKLPPLEQVLPTPYGRPPMLLSSRGRDLLVRPVPEPGKPLEPPQKVPGVIMTPAVAAQLSAPPVCELEGWSLQLVKQAKDTVVAISRQKTASFPLPAKVAQGAVPGCGAGRIAVEIDDPKPPDLSDPMASSKLKVTTLAVCPLDAPCAIPDKPPFRPWLEPHEQSMAAVPTSKGAVAVLTSRSPARWGLYLAQWLDDGKLFGVPRVIGEGVGDRGRIEIGALISFGSRILIVLEADVTGTSRRGWYVAVSDDGGLNWNPP